MKDVYHTFPLNSGKAQSLFGESYLFVSPAHTDRFYEFNKLTLCVIKGCDIYAFVNFNRRVYGKLPGLDL